MIYSLQEEQLFGLLFSVVLTRVMTDAHKGIGLIQFCFYILIICHRYKFIIILFIITASKIT